MDSVMNLDEGATVNDNEAGLRWRRLLDNSDLMSDTGSIYYNTAVSRMVGVFTRQWLRVGYGPGRI